MIDTAQQSLSTERKKPRPLKSPLSYQIRGLTTVSIHKRWQQAEKNTNEKIY